MVFLFQNKILRLPGDGDIDMSFLVNRVMGVQQKGKTSPFRKA